MSTTISTYITQAEEDVRYPNGVNADSDLREIALIESFGLVNSFLSSELILPAVPQWDGESAAIDAPAICKNLQDGFYRWRIETSNYGWSEELQNLWDSLVTLAKAVTQNELTVSPVEITPKQAGWHLTGVTNSQPGGIYVRGISPILRLNYKLVGLNIITAYVASVTFDVYRSDSSAKRNTTALTANFNWQNVDGMFDVRFDGQFQALWEARIVGVPLEDVNTVTKSNTIQQAPVGYGYPSK